MSLNTNGVFARDGHRTVTTNFDESFYSPDMDDMLDDRLEEARQNRTNFYRKMLASRSRPLDDYSVSRKVSYRSGNSPVKEPSISDSVPAGPLPQIPEPHSSWRFYTSFDNGEWKRHAVPVNHEEEEILREPTKSLRRVRDSDRSSQSPPVETSSLRKIRQNGGPLIACLQPRPRRTSEGHKTTTADNVHMIDGQPFVVGPDGSAEFVGQFGLPADWANISGSSGAVVRRYSDGGTEYLILADEPAKGSVRQEQTTKYTNTVKVTQPTGNRTKSLTSGKQGVAVVGGSGGGVEDGQGAEGESGVRKSRRPRIYGFQEKIIIPTKYKNAENQDGGEEKPYDTSTGQLGSKTLGSREDTTVKKGSSVEDRLTVKERRAGLNFGDGEGRVQVTEASHSTPGGSLLVKASSVAQDRAAQGNTVKVVVMNSGSDVESEKKSVELFSSEEDEKEHLDPTARKLKAGVMQLPNLFEDGAMEGIKALHESLHANLISGGASTSKDQSGSVSTIEDSASVVPKQRAFSKDEQSFSEVGPDGAKCDGKVLRTYEVITTADDDDEDSIVQLSSSPAMEIAIVPLDKAERSTFKTRTITSSGVNRTAKPETQTGSYFSQRHEYSPPRMSIPENRSAKPESHFGSHFSQQQIHYPSRKSLPENRTTKPETHFGSPFLPQQHVILSPRQTAVQVATVSPKTDDKKSTDIFEQTGSLFKTITPRPRNISESESVFAAREEHLRKAAGVGSVQPQLRGGGGFTSKTIRISASQPAVTSERDASNFGTAETARTKIVRVSNESQSPRQLNPSASAVEKLSVRDGHEDFTTLDGGSSLQSNATHGGLRSQGWSDETQVKKSNLKPTGNEKEWEVQVALKD